MANPVSESITLIIIIGTLGMLILAAAIVLFIIVYQKRYIKHQLEMEKASAAYQARMLQTITEVQEEERKRIAENLHDETGTLLSTIKLMLHRIGKNTEEPGASLLKESSRLLDESIHGIRRTIRDLTPAALENFGLIDSVRDLCAGINKAAGLKVSFHSEHSKLHLGAKTELALYRIIQEILNNAIKHSGANEISIVFRNSISMLHLTVEDNGKGFDPELQEDGKGLGLKNIESRVFLIRGRYTMESSAGKGTRYVIEVPL